MGPSHKTLDSLSLTHVWDLAHAWQFIAVIFQLSKNKQSLIESRPSFNEFYVEVNLDAMKYLRTPDLDSDRNHWLLGKRIIENAVLHYVLRSDPKKLEQWIKAHEAAYLMKNPRGIHFSDYKIVFLDITQRGKRLASDVVLEANFVKSPLGGACVETNLEQPSDEEMNQRMIESMPVEIELGSFEIGDNILVPLFFQVTVDAKDKGASNILALGNIFIPKSIRYTDSVTGEVLKHNIRKMLSVPIYIQPDILYTRNIGKKHRGQTYTIDRSDGI